MLWMTTKRHETQKTNDATILNLHIHSVQMVSLDGCQVPQQLVVQPTPCERMNTDYTSQDHRKKQLSYHALSIRPLLLCMLITILSPLHFVEIISDRSHHEAVVIWTGTTVSSYYCYWTHERIL